MSESELIPENEIIDSVRNSMPEILGHIFNIAVKTLRLYESVRREIKPNHRLADFVIFGEAISRAPGNESNAFLEAWKQNTDN